MPGNGSLPATKSDIDRLDNKIDSSIDRLEKKIDDSVSRLAKELVKTQADVRDIKTRMAGLATKEDVGQILNAIDAFSAKAVHYDRTAVLHGHALTEQDITLKDHGRRIKALESARK